MLKSGIWLRKNQCQKNSVSVEDWRNHYEPRAAVLKDRSENCEGMPLPPPWFFLNPARGVLVFIFSGELRKDHKAQDRCSRNVQKEGWKLD